MKTRPHEETWIADTDLPVKMVLLSDDLDEVVAEVDAAHATPAANRDRTRLIAQAPAMARLLLAGQWSGEDRGQGYTRPVCEHCGHGREEGHDDACELATVLRAAGVLP